MGAKYSYVAAAQRRLHFNLTNKKKLSNAAKQEEAIQEYERALALLMTPNQLFQELDINEDSKIEKWEVLRFLQREAASFQAAATAAIESSNGLNESYRLQISEIMSKIKQIWLKLDRPPSLPTVLMSGIPTMTIVGDKPRHSMNASLNGLSVPPISIPTPPLTTPSLISPKTKLTRASQTSRPMSKSSLTRPKSVGSLTSRSNRSNGTQSAKNSRVSTAVGGARPNNANTNTLLSNNTTPTGSLAMRNICTYISHRE